MKLITIVLLLVLMGCGDYWLSPENAKQFLEQQGYTEVQTTGARNTACGAMGPGAVGFRAKNPNGKIVTGTVCEGFNSGKLIVFD